MLSKIALNVRQSLQGRAGEALRRSLMSVPGVTQVTVGGHGQVEVQFDDGQAAAGQLMTVIRAHAAVNRKH